MDYTTDFSGLFTPQTDELSYESLLDRVQELEERVAMQSIDRLTSVLSTDEFYTTVRRILSENPSKSFLMWRFDIDKFQTVNKLFGVEEGNRLLIYCGKYLMSATKRERISAVGRIGADVFAGICPYIEGETPLPFASVSGEMESFFKGFRDDFRFSVSIGFYQIENHHDPVEILYSRALAAAKACKDNSELLYAFYDRNLSQAMEEKQVITAEMHSALENGEFTVYLQPKVRLSDLSLVGAEALVRWLHPKKGRIPPDDFIPIFEENGFITKLDLYVLRRCCAYIQSWMRQGMNLIPLSVNLSQMDLSTPGLPHKIQNVLGEYKVAAKYIHLEITESAYADDVEQVNGVTQAFKDLGFHLEMDDFGKGYSSLNMIAELPIDTLKLDMGFLQGEQEGSGKVISFVTSLARHMGLTTVAEGIETQEQLAFLRSINCDCGQGYLFSKPLPKSDFDAYMRRCEIGTIHNKVKEVDRSIAAYHGWHTNDIWEPDSPFSKMFNAFAGGVGICELNMLRGDFRLTRYNAEMVKVLHTTHELLKHRCEDLLSLVHPEDLLRLREMLKRISDPKEWNNDNGLQETELRIQILASDLEQMGNSSKNQLSYTWVLVRWRLVEFTAETRTYVISATDHNDKYEYFDEVEQRLEQVDDLERQMSIFSQAGLSGSATLRFIPEQEPELIYGNRHFFHLHSMEEDYEQIRFPLQLAYLYPKEELKRLNEKFMALFQGEEPTFEWDMKLVDQAGVLRNLILNGRVRHEKGIIYVDLVLSALSDVSTLEVELHRNVQSQKEMLSSAEVTLVDFLEGSVSYGTDLQLAYGLPSSEVFLPEVGFPQETLFHPESLGIFEKALADLLQNEGTKTIEVWMRHGNYVDFSLRRMTLFSQKDPEDGLVQQVRFISKDISKERYGTENVSVGQIITHIPDGLMVFSASSGKLLYANELYYEIVGLTQDKMEKQYKNYPLLLISEEASPEIALHEIAEEGRNFIREAQLKNHAMRWIELVGVRRGSYVYGTVRDITSRKELEILLDRETNFNVVLNNISDELMFRVDIQEKAVKYTGKAAKTFGLSGRYISFSLDSIKERGIVTPEHEAAFFEMVNNIHRGIEKTCEVQLRAVSDQISWYRFEYRIIHESGEAAFAVGKAVNIDYQVELLEQLERDVMTGCYNASAMKLRINQILNASFPVQDISKHEGEQEHALLVITIENYSDISAKLNFHQRDDLVVRVAESIRQKFRDTDLVGRISDGVFAVFMQHVSISTMPLQKASDLYLGFAQFNETEPDKLDIDIACSYASRDGFHYDSLLDQAQIILRDI